MLGFCSLLFSFLAVRACPPSTYLVSRATATTDNVCDGCSPGYYCLGGTTPKQECGLAKYSPGNDSSCLDVSTGYYLTGGSSNTTRADQQPCPIGYRCTDGIAVLCEPGSFQNATGQTTCLACQTCQAGLTATSDCSPSANRVCKGSHLRIKARRFYSNPLVLLWCRCNLPDSNLDTTSRTHPGGCPGQL